MAIAPALKVLMAEKSEDNYASAEAEFVWRTYLNADATREHLAMAKAELKVAKAELKVKVMQKRHQRALDEIDKMDAIYVERGWPT